MAGRNASSWLGFLRLQGTPTALLLGLFLVATLLIQAVSASVVDLEPGQAVSENRFAVPETIDYLKDATFDATVFAKREHPQSWFIFVFAPWCEHCKALIPQFFNASLILEHEIKYPHARFAIVNSQKSPRLSERLKVTTYPTLLYTTGREQQWHHYHSGHSTNSFVEFAVYLQRAVDEGSFADDVSDIHKFAMVETESGASRVPFYVFVPSDSASTKENQRDAGWNMAIDGAASIGNVRFSVIYERDMTPTWREEASSAYVQVVETALQCRANGKATGPTGEVLVSRSDRFRTPQCFSGEWVTAPAEGSSEPPRLSPLLEKYITVNGFRAVEELNGGMLSVLSRQKMNFLGLIVVDGPLSQDDPNILPAIRDMVQSANARLAAEPAAEALDAPQVTWTYVDGNVYELWRSRYSIKAAEMPAFLLVDTKRNRMYRTRTRIPEFEKIKRNMPWAIDGPQRQMLEEFVGNVFADKYWGEKRSIVGSLAERVAYFRVTGWMYEQLGYDEFALIIIVFAGGFILFLSFIAFVAEPMMEKRLAKQQAKEAAIKKSQ